MTIFLGSTLLNYELSEDQTLSSVDLVGRGKVTKQWDAVVVSLLNVQQFVNQDSQPQTSEPNSNQLNQIGEIYSDLNGKVLEWF